MDTGPPPKLVTQPEASGFTLKLLPEALRAVDSNLKTLHSVARALRLPMVNRSLPIWLPVIVAGNLPGVIAPSVANAEDAATAGSTTAAISARPSPFILRGIIFFLSGLDTNGLRAVPVVPRRFAWGQAWLGSDALTLTPNRGEAEPAWKRR
jgi:hypothetical protein